MLSRETSQRYCCGEGGHLEAVMHLNASRRGDRKEEMRQEIAGKVHHVEAGATEAELCWRGMAEGRG